MIIFDLVLLNCGCILSGLIAAASFILRNLPIARNLINTLIRYRTATGIVTFVAGIISLFLPADGPIIFGSFFPAIIGIAIGMLLSLEMFMEISIFKKRKELFMIIGNVLLYIKVPLGILSIIIGVCHIVYYKALFF